jgi:hypothetical protein
VSDPGWKKFERRCSRDMGTERIPVTGERHGADGATAMFCFQYKLRNALPDWLFEWLGGIVGTAERQQKIGVLVLKTPGMEDRDAIVMLRWSDWVDLHGAARFTQQPHRRRRTDGQEVQATTTPHGRREDTRPQPGREAERRTR